MKLRISALFLVSFLFSSSFAIAELDELPVYVPAQLEEGTLTSVGSDSMGDLVELWVSEYKKHQSSVSLQVVSRGSATAPAALIEGTADLGPMARPMKQFEEKDFISKYGFAPTQVRTALVGIGVFASKDNPRKSISFQELRQIYGANSGSNLKWADLGLSSPFAKNEIVAFGRREGTYVHAYFRQRVLRQKEFGDSLHTTENAASMIEALSMNPGGIAFGPMMARANSVKALAVRKTKGDSAFRPSEANIIANRYPLSRYLNIYVVREPGEALDESLTDFLNFVLSREGQKLVAQEGMLPLPASVVKEELAKLK